MSLRNEIGVGAVGPPPPFLFIQDSMVSLDFYRDHALIKTHKTLDRIVWHCMSGNEATESAPRMWSNASAQLYGMRRCPSTVYTIVGWLQVQFAST